MQLLSFVAYKLNKIHACNEGTLPFVFELQAPLFLKRFATCYFAGFKLRSSAAGRKSARDRDGR